VIQILKKNPRTTRRVESTTFKFSFDPSKCAPYIKLLNNNRTVVNGTSSISGTVLADKGFQEGKHYFECKIDQSTTVSDIMIGIVDSQVDLHNFLSHTKNGFALYGNNGSKYHNRMGSAYASTGFTTGDVVGVYVDFTEDTISFVLNGKPLSDKPAYTGISKGLVKGDMFYPAVTLYAANDKVTINTESVQRIFK